MPDWIDKIRQDLLPTTTVRISVNGRRAGTGFFVAPGIIVTCTHVLKGLDLAAREAVGMIDVKGLDQTPYEVKMIREVSGDDADDLALLRVAPGDSHACALLLSGLNVGDDAHAFGYTAKHEEGIPVSMVGEGLTGDEKLFKLKVGQVEHGMSGAPVLNVRTGAVCGVLKRTIDPRQAIGGYMIPVTTLFELSDAVATSNRAFHVARSDWLDLLPAAARQTWMGGGIADPDSGPPEQVLVISVAQQLDRWEVTAELHPGGKTLAPVPVDLNTVRLEVARLFRDWASLDTTWRGRVGRGEGLRLVGKILASAVLPGVIGDELEDLLANRGKDRWLQVALRFEEDTDPDLQYLPWEHLYLPSHGDTGEVYLAREPGVAFVRTRSGVPRQENPPAPSELSVLFASAQPAGDSESEREVAAGVKSVVNEAKELISGLDRVKFEVAQSLDANALVERIKTVRPDILHYVGFGQFDAGVDHIAMCRPGGTFDYLDVTTFRGILDAVPRVVVLQLCDAPSEMVAVRADLAPFAPQLLGRGVQAVVAYQYPIRSDHSAYFNKHFYGKVATGTAVEMAVQAARKALHLQAPESRAFLAPTVCVRQPGGLRLAAEDSEFARRNWAGAAAAYG